MPVTIDGSSLTLETIMRIGANGEKVRIGRASIKKMERFRALLQEKLDRGDVVYGVNTGFGSLSNKDIPKEQVRQLQLNLIRSHAVGVGEPLSAEVVRAAMAIRLNSIINGNSAARPVVATTIMGMLNSGLTPYVPCLGSLGASGDLAPSAHMALTMVGEGRAFYDGRLIDASEGLARSRLRSIRLEAKEGLSLINGTCFTTALAAVATHRAKLLLEAANASVALTAEAVGACGQSFDERLMALRRFRPQAQVAQSIRAMLRGSRRIRTAPLPQDPYSIRCAPQVHGSAKHAIDSSERVVTEEMNSVTDNPVLTDDGQVLHGGNFHAQNVAMASDFLCIALAYLGTISLARIHFLLSESPAEAKYGARKPGFESGLMVTEYTATALVAENAKEIHPASAFPANVSAGIEDHASFGMNAGLKAMRIVENVSRILAIELVNASNRATPFEGELSPYGLKVRSKVTAVSPPLSGDRVLNEEIENLSAAILKGQIPHPPRDEYTSTPSLKTLST
ncbi:MAG TPA: aromatic amino acid ammonia-lyase [Nitrososphaerales archaeon]|nr:aromatic amino acid ammonia-lyase [Nitrososphaerales archaeon]